MSRCLYIQGVEEGSLGCLENALSFINSLVDTTVPRPSLLLNTAFVLIEKARIHGLKGDHQQGQELFRQSSQILEGLLTEFQHDKALHRVIRYANSGLHMIASINKG